MKNKLLVTVCVSLLFAVLTVAILLLGMIYFQKTRGTDTEVVTEELTIEEEVATPDVATINNAIEEAEEEAEEEEPEEATPEDAVPKENPKNKILISIDPGHQGPNVDMSASEPIAPSSSETKMKATGGTSGRYTGVPEYQLNLDISLMLRNRLQEQGYKVIMTRENNDTAISNKERACLANDSGANISIRIHANGSDDSSQHGALAMIGSASNPDVGNLYEDSHALASCVLDEYCASTGMSKIGIQETDDMTGINWSKVPVMILEMGFMTNQQDDYNMQEPEYQKKMVKGIVNGINKYYGFSDTPDAGEAGNAEHNEIGGELKEKIDAILEEERDKGAVCSAYARNLTTDETIDLTADTHRSASVIKLFVAGAVYKNMEQLTLAGNSEESIESLIKSMITVSDNDSTNQLVKMLGYGSADEGMKVVNEFISSMGYTETNMGRLMLDFSSGRENYTTVAEVGDYLEKIYKNEFTGADKILSYMKQQERVGKIPSGIPSGIVVANKTGELDDVEHDVAIIYGEKSDIILCVLLSQLKDTASGRETIKKIAKTVYEYWN